MRLRTCTTASRAADCHRRPGGSFPAPIRHRRRTCPLPWLALLLLLTLTSRPAAARLLTVGAGQDYPTPSAAAGQVQDGDTVEIAPGSYFDCALWRANRLTIAGIGTGVVLTDRACAGKAAFVISGNDVTVRNLTFTRIRVPDGNGAGIRSEGQNLTVTDSQFINNQVGILSGVTGGVLRIERCLFDANGASFGGVQTHAVRAGALDLLAVEHTTFQHARGGDHVYSTARRTELVDNQLDDEGGHMSGPLVFISGGTLLVSGNHVALAAAAAERPGAMLVVGDVPALTVRDNTLVEAKPGVALLRNWSGTEAVASGNTVPPGVAAVSDSGSTYHRLRGMAAAGKQATRHVLGRGWHLLQRLVPGR